LTQPFDHESTLTQLNSHEKKHNACNHHVGSRIALGGGSKDDVIGAAKNSRMLKLQLASSG